jgi:DNA repair protein SbcC/Rad50
MHSVAETEEALSAAKDELARIRQLDATLTQTTRFLKDAQDRIHRTIAPKLAASVYDWLPKITADRYQEVLVDPETLDVSVRGKDRPWRKAALLSHGTAEQIYMLLRVAMAEHLTKAGEVCPLVLDDVTVQCDSQRKVAVLSMLQRISERRQVILFSQESAVLAWAAEHLREPEHRIEQLDTSLVVA